MMMMPVIMIIMKKQEMLWLEMRDRDESGLVNTTEMSKET